MLQGFYDYNRWIGFLPNPIIYQIDCKYYWIKVDNFLERYAFLDK